MNDVTNEIIKEFFSRHENVEPFVRKMDEFPLLKVKRINFKSYQNEELRGYIFTKSNIKPKAVLVLAHGLGIGGAFCYLDVIDYFVKNDFLVFAYDATGNAESGGSSCLSLEQGIIDLAKAIEYVKKDKIMGTFPLVLWGHSWGAYSVSAVLSLYKDIKAVCEVAAFNDVEREFKYQLDYALISGNKQKEILSELMMANENNVPELYKNLTALDGFKNSKANVFILHGNKDINVPNKLGYDLFLKEFKDNKRFVFKLYKDRTHFDLYYTDEARKYRLEFNDKNGYDGFNKKIGSELDLKLMDEIRDFYLRSIILN